MVLLAVACRRLRLPSLPSPRRIPLAPCRPPRGLCAATDGLHHGRGCLWRLWSGTRDAVAADLQSLTGTLAREGCRKEYRMGWMKPLPRYALGVALFVLVAFLTFGSAGDRSHRLSIAQPAELKVPDDAAVERYDFE